MNKQKWIQDDSGIFYPISASTVLHLTPGPGIFKICQGNNPNDKRIGLMRVQAEDKFEFPGKKYSLGTESFVKRVIDCWNSDNFIDNKKNLAIGLTGLKGAGKTYLAKDIANALDLPILILDNDFEGLVVDFIVSLEFECVILIDEAEKVFNRDNGNAHILLRIIDGVSNQSRKFYILTTNNMDIDDNFLGRPGRLRYIKKFTSLPSETVQEVINDLLEDKSKEPEVKDLINSLSFSTIDTVRSIIEEFNTFGDILDRDTFNLPISPYTYYVITFNDELRYEDLGRLTSIFNEVIPKGADIYSWLMNGEKCEDDPDYTKNQDLLSKKIGLSGPYDVDVNKMTATSPVLFQGQETSLGTVIETPDKNGFFLIRRKDYRGSVTTALYKLAKESETSLLYNKAF